MSLHQPAKRCVPCCRLASFSLRQNRFIPTVNLSTPKNRTRRIRRAVVNENNRFRPTAILRLQRRNQIAQIGLGEMTRNNNGNACRRFQMSTSLLNATKEAT